MCMTKSEIEQANRMGWRLAANWEESETDYVWSQDGVDFYTEAEVCVEVLRATVEHVRVEIDRLSKSPSLACQTVAACVLAILDGKEDA